MNTPQTSTPLRDHPELAVYREALARWLGNEESDDASLRAAGAALCDLGRTHQLTAEQLLIVVRGEQRPFVPIEGTHREARLSQERAQRATIALRILLECYYQ